MTPLRLPEFIALMAVLISLIALSIDAMLPVLPAIGADLGIARTNDLQWVIGIFFAGFGVGQLIYGPLSDSYGRRPLILAGLILFGLGCLLSLLADTYELMLLGRFLQGLGAAGPRTVSIAVVRDQYAGRPMARIMSFVMAVFILVPALAPAVGQGIAWAAGWRAIFLALLALGLIAAVWMMTRLPESLSVEKRLPLSAKRIALAAWETLSNRVALGYTIAAGIMFAAFIGYLTSSQQVFRDVFGIVDMFPAYFAVLALAIGASSVFNARVVMRWGMRRISFAAVFALTALSLSYAASLMVVEVSVISFMAWALASFFCIGLLFANLNALAMEPMGHIAGTASAVIGSTTSLIALGIGAWIGQSFDGSVVPVVLGFGLLGALSAAIMLATNRGQFSGAA